MGKETGIAWTHHTFNPWWGCEKVSPGCTNCYAEAFDRRLGGTHWGNAPRRFFGDKHWMEPVHWNRVAGQIGERRRVFCASMADVFEFRQGDDEQALARMRLWRLIEETPHLDWLLLTKRPEAIKSLLPASWQVQPRANVWLGTSVEDQDRADERVPKLLEVPARVRFLLCEPLLGPVDLRAVAALASCRLADKSRAYRNDPLAGMPPRGARIDWVIAGGESGSGARPCDVAWIRSLRDQCAAAGVAFFCKQLGARAVEMVPRAPDSPAGIAEDLMRRAGFAPDPRVIREMDLACSTLVLRAPKGDDPGEWPAGLRVQEFPR